MASNVTVAQSNLPAHLRAHVPQEALKEFSGGVQSGFPVISYRGRTWRVKQGGEEQVYLNEQGDAMQSIEVVLLKSNPTLSKTHYEGKYTEGDKGKPRCWSANGVTPDSDVPNPVNSTCAGCPMNVWGSKTTEEGKKTKACQDVRRVAVAFLHEIEAVVAGEKSLDDMPVMLCRIPPASLNPLKDYAERVLAPKGAAPFMLATRIGFDTDVSYPKLTFKGSRWLSEPEFSIVSELRDSDTVKRILDTSAEHATEGTTDDGGEAANSPPAAKAEATTSAPSGASTEELNFSEPVDDDIAPAPEPTRAAAVEAAAAADVIAPAPPAPAKAAKPAQKQTSKPAAAPAVESPDADDDSDIDDMLSSILED